MLKKHGPFNLSWFCEKLKLQSNTLTPLVKRIKNMDLVKKVRSLKDKRSIIISLKPKGKKLQTRAPMLYNQLKKQIDLSGEEAA